MFIPANIDEQVELMFGGKLKQPFGWHIINPDQIAAQFMNLGKVSLGLLRRTEWLARRVGSERSIGDAFHIIFSPAKPEEFPIHADAWAGGGGLYHGTWTGSGPRLIISSVHSRGAQSRQGREKSKLHIR